MISLSFLIVLAVRRVKESRVYFGHYKFGFLFTSADLVPFRVHVDNFIVQLVGFPVICFNLLANWSVSGGPKSLRVRSSRSFSSSFWRWAICSASLAWISLFCFDRTELDWVRSSIFFTKISFFFRKSIFISVMTWWVARDVFKSSLVRARSFWRHSLSWIATLRLLLSFAKADLSRVFSLRAAFSSTSASWYLGRRRPKTVFACGWSVLIYQFKINGPIWKWIS